MTGNNYSSEKNDNKSSESKKSPIVEGVCETCGKYRKVNSMKECLECYQKNV